LLRFREVASWSWRAEMVCISPSDSARSMAAAMADSRGTDRDAPRPANNLLEGYSVNGSTVTCPIGASMTAHIADS
jgi:hypothetical protein